MLNYATFCPKQATRTPVELHAQAMASHHEPLLTTLRLAQTTADVWLVLSQLLVQYNYIFTSRFGGPCTTLFGGRKTTRRCGTPDVSMCSKERADPCSACCYKETLLQMFKGMCPSASESELLSAERRVESLVKLSYPPLPKTAQERSAELTRSYSRLATPIDGPRGEFKGDTSKMFKIREWDVAVTSTFPIVAADRREFFARINREPMAFAIDPTTRSMVPVFQKMMRFAYDYSFSMTRQYHGSGEVKPVVGDWETKVFDVPPCALTSSVATAVPTYGKEVYRTCYRCRMCQMWKDIAKLMIGNDPQSLQIVYRDINNLLHPIDLPPGEKVPADTMRRVDMIMQAMNSGTAAVDSVSMKSAAEKNALDMQQLALKRKADAPAVVVPASASASASGSTSEVKAESPNANKRQRVEPTTPPPSSQSFPDKEVDIELLDSRLNQDLELTQVQSQTMSAAAENQIAKDESKEVIAYRTSLARALEHPAIQGLWTNTFGAPYAPNVGLRPRFQHLKVRKTFTKYVKGCCTEYASMYPELKCPPVTDDMCHAFRIHCLEEVMRLLCINVRTAVDNDEEETAWLDFMAKARMSEMMQHETVDEALVALSEYRELMECSHPNFFYRALWAIIIHMLVARFENVETEIVDKKTTGEKMFDAYWQYGAMCSVSELARKIVIESVNLTWTDFTLLLTQQPGRPCPAETFTNAVKAASGADPFMRWRRDSEASEARRHDFYAASSDDSI